MNKKVSFLLGLLLLVNVVVNAQTVSSFFEKYAENEQFRFVSISKGMINLASLFGKEDAGNEQMLSHLDEMKVLTLHASRKSNSAKAFFVDIESLLDTKPAFVGLMEAREKGVYTKVLNRQNKNNKTDIVIVSKSDTVQHVIWLSGKIATEELQRMIKK